jgi:SOS-response transcriptional repressor LexA
MKPMPLTPPQLRVYKIINNSYKKNKVSPTIEEIKTVTGYKSKGSVWSMLRVLKFKGYLDIVDYKARAYIPLVDL